VSLFELVQLLQLYRWRFRPAKHVRITPLRVLLIYLDMIDRDKLLSILSELAEVMPINSIVEHSFSAAGLIEILSRSDHGTLADENDKVRTSVDTGVAWHRVG